MLPEYNGGSQCSVKPGSPNRIRRDVGNLFEGSYPTPGNGTSARAYFPIESTNTTPPTLVNNYNPLTQGGIAVVNPNGRSPAQNAELQAFVAFLTDFTQPPTPDSPVMTTLKRFCYSAP